jgi:hypothetical protein
VIEPIGAFTLAEARKSAWLVSAVLLGLAAWAGVRERSVLALALGGAAAAVLIGSAIPAAARRFHRSWMTLAGVLGYVNSRIILSLLYFVVLFPIGFIVRLTGYDPLGRRGSPSRSYWHRRAATRQTHEGYERSF